MRTKLTVRMEAYKRKLSYIMQLTRPVSRLPSMWLVSYPECKLTSYIKEFNATPHLLRQRRWIFLIISKFDGAVNFCEQKKEKLAPYTCLSCVIKWGSRSVHLSSLCLWIALPSQQYLCHTHSCLLRSCTDLFLSNVSLV